MNRRPALPIQLLWIFSLVGVAIVSTSLPLVTWYQNHPMFFPPVHGYGFAWEKVFASALHWDSDNYLTLAEKGYVGSDRIAFFPGWPALLWLMLKPFGFSLAAKVLVPLVWNIVLLCFAVQTWLKVFANTPFLQRCDWNLSLEEKAVWLFIFYPSTIFCLVPYPETTFVFLAGRCFLACQRQRGIELAFWLPLLITIKHIGILAAAAIAVWALLYLRQRRLLVLLSFALGCALVLGFYWKLTGDPFAWAAVQAKWNRKFTLPHRLFFTLKNRGVEMILYVLLLFAVPLDMLRRTLGRSGIQPLDWLPLFFTAGVFLPVWFGGTPEALYRILYLVPFLIPELVLWFGRSGNRRWRAFQIGVFLLNIHGIYRFMQSLGYN